MNFFLAKIFVWKKEGRKVQSPPKHPNESNRNVVIKHTHTHTHTHTPQIDDLCCCCCCYLGLNSIYPINNSISLYIDSLFSCYRSHVLSLALLYLITLICPFLVTTGFFLLFLPFLIFDQTSNTFPLTTLS